MIKYTNQTAIKNQIFKTPFQRELDMNNRWVRLSDLIPWDKMAVVYMKYMSSKRGRTTIDLRTVMGAMYIQHSLNLTDRDTIELISENIYMQYFVGLSSFQIEPIFDHSLLSIFRQRIGEDGSKQLNDIVINDAIEKGEVKHRKSRSKNNKKEDDEKNQEEEANSKEVEVEEISSENRGTVKMDATVVPQNITYPTDAKLLNHSREISEDIIDELYEQLRIVLGTKPRTYRREARNKWLVFSKSRKQKGKTIRKQIKTQLRYLQRNLSHIDMMLGKELENGNQLKLKARLRKKMYVISEIYRQQKEMVDRKQHKTSDRIVSVSQPWVRPIVRGKAGRPVEFGAKINISLTEKIVIVDNSSFDAFNESTGFIDQLKSYKERFGYYPEFALVDKIYLTRANRKFMKDNGIMHTGSPLGRPSKIAEETKKKLKKKNNERNHVEGKFGQGKQKYGWDKLRTKTVSSSLCAINLIAMVMNLFTLLKKDLYFVFSAIRSLIKALTRPTTVF